MYSIPIKQCGVRLLAFSFSLWDVQLHNHRHRPDVTPLGISRIN
jgi:hypothetical protein